MTPPTGLLAGVDHGSASLDVPIEQPMHTRRNTAIRTVLIGSTVLGAAALTACSSLNAAVDVLSSPNASPSSEPAGLAPAGYPDIPAPLATLIPTPGAYRVSLNQHDGPAVTTVTGYLETRDGTCALNLTIRQVPAPGEHVITSHLRKAVNEPAYLQTEENGPWTDLRDPAVSTTMAPLLIPTAVVVPGGTEQQSLCSLPLLPALISPTAGTDGTFTWNADAYSQYGKAAAESWMYHYLTANGITGTLRDDAMRAMPLDRTMPAPDFLTSLEPVTVTVSDGIYTLEEGMDSRVRLTLTPTEPTAVTSPDGAAPFPTPVQVADLNLPTSLSDLADWVTNLPDVNVPNLSNLNLPDINVPDMNLPDITLPNFG
jgi:hypothetical protein